MGNISLKDGFSDVTSKIDSSASSISNVSNGLHKRDDLNLHTVDKMYSLYGKITTLMQNYGKLLSKDVDQFNAVAKDMRDFDNQMGRLRK